MEKKKLEGTCSHKSQVLQLLLPSKSEGFDKQKTSEAVQGNHQNCMSLRDSKVELFNKSLKFTTGDRSLVNLEVADFMSYDFVECCGCIS